jgi:hypothetical protein
MAEIENMKKKGNKQEVYEGKALCTAGGLKKEDLCLNKKGSIVSKKRSEQGKKQIGNLTGGHLKKAIIKKEEAKSLDEEDDDDVVIEEKKNSEIINMPPIISQEKDLIWQQPHDPIIKQNDDALLHQEVLNKSIEELKHEEPLPEAPKVIPSAPIKKVRAKKIKNEIPIMDNIKYDDASLFKC